ncbi:MAG: efflux transporter periplasmic adaptor subunit, partial [Burkholderiales bacterium]|nr:efflux transporter periplasmic adaptor subunit [Flavobacterium sp.]
MKFKHIIYTLLIVSFGAFIAYRITANKNKNEDSKDKSGKNKTMTLNGIVVKTQTFDNNLSLSGSLEANEQV